jgi:hypothetical protein
MWLNLLGFSWSHRLDLQPMVLGYLPTKADKNHGHWPLEGTANPPNVRKL